jgi:hypothetical protein
VIARLRCCAPPQDNLMVKDRGPFLFWMLNERAPAAAAAR